jgi:hypothetical protein
LFYNFATPRFGAELPMTEQHDESGKKPHPEQEEGFSREDKEFLEDLRELPDVKTPPDFHEKVMETIKQRQWAKDEEARREQQNRTPEK